MSKKNTDRIYIFLSFLFPILFLCLFFFQHKIIPFGNGTFLIHDMNYQYADYFAYLHSILSGENSFNYVFSRGLGGDFSSLWAYYLASPLSLIPTAFPDELMPLGISIEMFLLFGLTGLSCYFSFSRLVPECDANTRLYISLAYSMSAWMLLNAENFQFLSAAAVFPMAAAALSEMKRSGKLSVSVILWLSFTAIVNFYIGYMIWIFAFLWLLIPDEKTVCPKMMLVFIIACIICLPVFYSVIQRLIVSVKVMDPSWYIPSMNFNLIDLLKKFLPGQFNASQYMDKGLPAVYCGLIPLVCVLIRIFQKSYSEVKRHRFIILLIILLSLIFRPLTMIWQGFNTPHWWPYRFSFLLIFMVLLIAAESRIRIPWFILIIGAGELFFNMEKTLPIKLTDAVPADRYAAEVSNKRQWITSIKDNDPQVYRIDDLAPRSDNDPMHFSYYGITNFESMARADTMDFLRNLGFPVDRYTVSYGLGNTAFANALLGVRYVLDGESIIPSGYPVGLAFITGSTMQMGPFPAEDSIQFQNDLAQSLGAEHSLLTEITAEDAVYYNIECTDQYCWNVDPEESARIIYRFSADRDVNLYAHTDIPIVIGSMIFRVDGKLIEVNSPDYFLPLGKIAAGDDVSIELEITDPVSDVPEKVLEFIVEDVAAVKGFTDDLFREIDIERRNNTDLKISFPKSEVPRTLVITVPYESRWRAFSDGVKLPISAWSNIFLSVPVFPETSEILLQYR